MDGLRFSRGFPNELEPISGVRLIWDQEGEAVFDACIQTESAPHLQASLLGVVEASWFAIQTVPRHEKRTAQRLREQSVSTFLPLLKQIHRWSDRQQVVHVPLFSCYVFIHTGQTVGERLKILRTPGVLGFVGSERQGTPIPEQEIESLRTTIRQEVAWVPYPFIRVGNRVRIRGGALDGVEGVLVRQGGDQRLVVSVELLQRSVAIRVDGYDLELA
jgi:transcription termination/antitermination protein NusG